MTVSRLTYVCSPPARSTVAKRAFTAMTVLLGVGALSACADVSELTKTRVAASEVAVNQTQQTIGTSEGGAVELQQARESLEAAKSAMNKGEDEAATRLAGQAQLHAELAAAQAQNAEARRAADELRASTDSLRSEAERNTPTQR
jgi:chromosome segregation ATPase